MDVEVVNKWVTVTGASIAAIASVWNLLLQARGKRDRYIVGLGRAKPSIEPETMMHVVSHSDHPIELKDWGFIEPDGRLSSVQLDWEAGELQADEISHGGDSNLTARNARFESGYQRRTPVLGAFAITMTEKRPRLCFHGDVPVWRRMQVRSKVAWRGRAYLSERKLPVA